MATSDKDFRVKNGLVVQGATATVNGHNVLTDASSLNDFADVDTASVSDGAPLIFNQTSLKWIPGSGIVNITVGDTKPSNPSAKDLFFNTTNGGLYIYYSDADTSQWVQIGTSGPSGIVTVSSPLVNSGTATAAVLSINQSLLSIANTQVTGLGTASTKDVATTGNATTSQVVKGDDTRLTDARTPTTHVHDASDITSGKLEVARGGTGNSDLTSGAYLKGNGTFAISSQVGIPAGDITSGILTIERGGTGVSVGSGMVPIIPSSVSVGSGSASVSATGLITISGASSLQLNGIFSSAYQNYRIILTQNGSNAVNMHYFRYTQGGSQISGANYTYSHFYTQAASSGNTDNGAGATTGNLGYGGHLDIEVYRPFESTATHKLITNFNVYSQTAIWGSAAYQGTGSFDGIIFSNNTLTGYAQVYGYK